MKKFCILFSLLMSTMVFTACGAGIKYSSDSNSSGSKQTKNAELVELLEVMEMLLFYRMGQMMFRLSIVLIPEK